MRCRRGLGSADLAIGFEDITAYVHIFGGTFASGAIAVDSRHLWPKANEAPARYDANEGAAREAGTVLMVRGVLTHAFRIPAVVVLELDRLHIFIVADVPSDFAQRLGGIEWG